MFNKSISEIKKSWGRNKEFLVLEWIVVFEFSKDLSKRAKVRTAPMPKMMKKGYTAMFSPWRL
jgi:hypothetical protein